MTHLKHTLTFGLVAAALLMASGCDFAHASVRHSRYHRPRVTVSAGYDWGHAYYRPTVYHSGYSTPRVIVSHNKPSYHKSSHYKPTSYHKPSHHKPTSYHKPTSHHRSSPVTTRSTSPWRQGPSASSPWQRNRTTTSHRSGTTSHRSGTTSHRPPTSHRSGTTSHRPPTSTRHSSRSSTHRR
ncbi:MAG: hypothetical protein HN909_08290 [Phycisphaerales bacterium]|jgi:hypothetical protein|nr:hypothetical protein [Phycisphaerales bacterium]MBT7171754.1 hypothetical protein [Phycisphaerales bacterium]